MTVVYQNGLPVISVRLPSRRERCQFTLKPISDSVGVFLRQLQEEDRGIDRVAIYSPGTVASAFHSHPKPLSLTLENTGVFALQVCMTAPSCPRGPRDITVHCQQMCAHRESHSDAAHIDAIPRTSRQSHFMFLRPLVITVGAECVFPVAEPLNVYQNSVYDLRLYNKTLKTLI